MLFSISLTAEQISLIGKSLGERPYHEVVGLINDIQNQVNQQMQASQVKTEAVQQVKPKK